jgi:hypothetical protein
VIPFPFNPARDRSRSRLNGEGGFPHSEICGSKVAHTSPQLIAACHVLHRLCMPRHPRIALTSRLRAHTTNDRTDRSISLSPLGAGNLLSIVIVLRHTRPLRRARFAPARCRLDRASRHRFLEPIHNVKDEVVTSLTAPFRSGSAFASSLENLTCAPSLYDRAYGGAYRDRTDDLMLAKQPLSQLS